MGVCQQTEAGFLVLPPYILPRLFSVKFLIRSPDSEDEKHPQGMNLPPPYFTVRMVLIEVWPVLGLHHAQHFETCPNAQSWSHHSKNTSSLGHSHVFIWLFLNSGFFLSTLPYSHQLCRALQMVVLCTLTRLHCSHCTLLLLQRPHCMFPHQSLS